MSRNLINDMTLGLPKLNYQTVSIKSKTHSALKIFVIFLRAVRMTTNLLLFMNSFMDNLCLNLFSLVRNIFACNLQKSYTGDHLKYPLDIMVIMLSSTSLLSSENSVGTHAIKLLLSSVDSIYAHSVAFIHLSKTFLHVIFKNVI